MRWLMFVLTVLVSCTSPRAPIDQVSAKSVVIHMNEAFRSVRYECDGRIPKRDCDVLIQASDAIKFLGEGLDPWDEQGSRLFGCIGKTVYVGMSRLRERCLILDIEEPRKLADALLLSDWAAKWADDSCDPYHPTTTVKMSEAAWIPKVEPDYPVPPTFPVR